MKLLNSIVLIILITVSLCGQDITIIHNGREVQAQPANENQWIVLLDDEVFLLLQESEIRALLKQIELLRAEIEHRDSILASRERLITAYEIYQNRADEHIDAQQQIIIAADSLFHGYRSLYTDLKQLIATPSISFNGGLGVIYLEDDTWRPVGMLGVQYHRWLAQYQIGRRYHGLIIGFQLPLWY